MFRYRTLKSIFEYNELINHNIYFSDVEEDKHEGYVNYYWKGDKIVWRNLISHFYLTFVNLLILGTDYPYEEGIYINAIFKFFGKNFDYKRMGLNYLLNDKIVSDFLNEISDKKTINISQLKLFFLIIIVESLKSYEKYSKKISNNKSDNDDPFNLNIMKALDDSDENRILSSYYKLQLLWADKVNEFFKQKSRKFKQILSTFPENYIYNLCKITNPTFYIASFSKNPDDEVMWTNYADSNKGVCLEFSSDKSLDLLVPYSFSLDDRKYKTESLKYEKIDYSLHTIDLNFFENIGAISQMYSESFLMDENNNKSSSYHNVYDDLESWRHNYWDCFHKAYNKKMKRWSFEDEYRLVLPEFLGIYESQNDRVLNYDIKDLKSITFGENTPQVSKNKIINIVKKIKNNNFSNFSFYQQTVNSNGKIIRVKI